MTDSPTQSSSVENTLDAVAVDDEVAIPVDENETPASPARTPRSANRSRSENPMHVSQLSNDNREQDAPVAVSFGGYFDHPATRQMAFTLIILSIIGAVLVVARNAYRLAVLSPLGLSEIEPDNETSTDVSEPVTLERTDITAADIANVVVGLLIGLSIPFCGFFGARTKHVGW
eukprot:CAMPEP_0204895470 /NCGR_PEP_ID=MMETSP1349-20130617/34046_1 /ASSEMBLY_ACC=CAM_ASM_000710 /TAXON_ID=215587 /ORGANISM="Aplanochytrium stocchinoi, Strain GSBS06" /LENGTH=173 /DNA_ID=CAMNT_0052062851 /DNA_START=139 /DNA_END=657 /DNA_ORIENTATION=+